MVAFHGNVGLMGSGGGGVMVAVYGTASNYHVVAVG
jgi:hypothetical protein